MNLLLAPIQGITDAFYRNTYAEIFGNIDTYYAPFIGTSQMRRTTSSVFDDLLPNINNKLNIVPQLLSNDSDDFKYYAFYLKSLGYNEVNWNIGCPFHRIARKKRGSGILPHSDLIKTFLDQVCSDKTYELSIKMRLGLEHKDEGLEIIELFNDYPIKDVTIHGRVGKQLYSGQVDLDAFEELYSKSIHKVIYNGDIYTLDNYTHIHNRFPNINDFMIGRGALTNPFLASSIKGIHYSNAVKLQKLITFHERILNYYSSLFNSDIRFLGRMKEFWVYLGVYIDPSESFINKVKQCSSLSEYQQLINYTFEHSDHWIQNF